MRAPFAPPRLSLPRKVAADAQAVATNCDTDSPDARIFAAAPPDLRRRIQSSNGPQAMISQDLTEAKLLRAVYSERQLDEVLTDFWYNHFNVFLE